MDDVRGDILVPTHDTTPAATIANKIKLRSLRAFNNINEKGGMPYCGFGYLGLFSDPIELTRQIQRELLYFVSFDRVVDTKTSIISKWDHIYQTLTRK